MEHRNRIKTLGSLALLAVVGSSGAQAAEAFSSESKWMTGDWGGTRTELLEKGYDFTLDYVGEVAGNLHGGYNDDKTARYSDQFALGAHLDLEKIFGWKDTEFKLAITERSGRNLSNDRISDPRAGQFSSVQEVWGRGQTWRLTQMWVKQKYFDGALDVKFGRFGAGEDFNSFPYEQNPSNLETGNGFKLSGSGTKGAILPVEAVWSPKVNGLPGEYRLGYYYSTAKADDVYDDINGNPQALTGAAFKSHSSKHGWWVVAQQQVTAHAGDVNRGLSLFANFTVHDKATNVVDNYQQVGMVYKGAFDARPKDDIGFGIARIHVNDDVKKRAELLNAQSGINDYDNPGFAPLQRTEYNAELYYGFHVTNWLTVRPNLQYIKSPGGVDEVDNALVAGLKIQSSF